MQKFNITNKTGLNLVIGHPLTHSQSPVLHNFIYRALDLDSVLLACDHPDLASSIQACITLNVPLIAVTMPFKESIVALLDECSAEVTQLGAANTVIFREKKLYGYNTDVAGIRYALRNTVLTHKRILILGAGGAARAVASVLHSQHGVQLFWFNRNATRAQLLANEFGGTVFMHEQLAQSAADIDVIINTTPLGMYPQIETSSLSNYPFQSRHTVFDLIYNPIETALLRTAKLHGATIISGLDMFIGQGIQQIELWTGKNINEDKKLIATLRTRVIQSLESMEP